MCTESVYHNLSQRNQAKRQMEPDRKVRDRISQPSDIATKQQDQPGSKNKHIHKKTHPALSL